MQILSKIVRLLQKTEILSLYSAILLLHHHFPAFPLSFGYYLTEFIPRLGLESDIALIFSSGKQFLDKFHMNEDTPNTEKDLSQKEGKKKAKGSPKRQLIPAANYKQSVRDTFTDKESAGGDLYTMAEICQKYNYTYGRFYNLRMRYSIPCVKANATKCFPKAEVDKAMAQEAERLGSNLSEHWYSCFDIMRLFGLGKTQVRRFALTHGVRTKRIHGNRLYYLKADWDEARKVSERKSASTKAKREPDNESDNN